MVNNNTESDRISALETRLGELKNDVSQKFTSINDTLKLLELQTEMLLELTRSTRGKAPVEDREQAEKMVQGKSESGLLATPSMGKQTLEDSDPAETVPPGKRGGLLATPPNGKTLPEVTLPTQAPENMLWDQFITLVRDRFANADDENLIGKFKELKAYMVTMNRSLGEDYFTKSFTSGLKEEIGQLLKIMKPITLQSAVQPAIKQEYMVWLQARGQKTFFKSPVVSQWKQGNKVKEKLVSNEKNLPTRRLTPIEMEARRKKNLYYNCDEIFHVGHKCKRLFLLMVEEEEEEESSELVFLLQSGDEKTEWWHVCYKGSGFRAFARVLLYDVASNWLACFPASARKHLYDAFFLDGCATEIVQVVVPCLQLTKTVPHDASVVCSNAERLLVLCLRENDLVLQMAEEFTIGCQLGDLSHEQLKQAISRASQLITSITDKARRGAPTSLSPHIFFKRLTTQLLSGAEDWDLKLVNKSTVSNKNHIDVTILCVGEAFARICHRDSADVWLSEVISLILGHVRSVLSPTSDLSISEIFGKHLVIVENAYAEGATGAVIFTDKKDYGGEGKWLPDEKLRPPTGIQVGTVYSGAGELAVVNLTYQGKQVISKIENVIGIIRGAKEPDRFVILGNHRDAWTFGAADPNSGTACLPKVAKRLWKLQKKGWKPRRTIILCNWDAEEYGLIVSTEWVEENGQMLTSRTVAYLNVDVAVAGAGFEASETPQLDQQTVQAAKQVWDPDNSSQTIYDSWINSTNSPVIGRLGGGGSDYAAFIQHISVPAANFSFGGGYPVYHSMYDDFVWMNKFSDPMFQRHVAVTSLWGLVAVKLADDLILPFNYLSYALKRQKSAEDLRRLMMAERAFTNREGLTERWWYKHLIYAPSKHDDYGMKRWKASILIYSLEDKLSVDGGKCYDRRR